MKTKNNYFSDTRRTPLIQTSLLLFFVPRLRILVEPRESTNKQTDVSVQPTCKWIERISQSEREIPQNQFMGFLCFPIWVWGSAPSGRLSIAFSWSIAAILRYSVLFARPPLAMRTMTKSISYMGMGLRCKTTPNMTHSHAFLYVYLRYNIDERNNHA